ncbi:MAG: hypothetical protein KGP29_03560 [Proteobacteria bacterium]|nr:hypothetical protein [Pseudomonadota bacterium]
MQKHQHANSRPKHKKKKKLGLFYGTVSSISIIAFIAIFYFSVLVSTKPRSILLVTQKIELILQEKFGRDNVSIDNSYLSFTNYGTLKISISGLRILYPDLDGSGKKSFIVPNLETEFSLFGFLLLQFQPNKIKLSDPNIFLGDWQKITDPKENFSTEKSDLSLIANLLGSIRKGENPIENLEIENAKLLIRGENFERKILLKKSKIHVTSSGNNLNIVSQNQINLDPKKSDLNISSSCQVSSNVICNLSVQNIILSSLAEFHPNLSELEKINATIDANISFALNNNDLKNLKFKIHSNFGDFRFLDFFAKKIDFENLSIDGEYDHDKKILNLSKIETDLKATNPENKTRLSLSLLISQFDQNRKFDFDIHLKNASGDEIEKFWPITLREYGVRDWVINHVKGGSIKEAAAKFSLSQKNQEFYLDSVSANADFSGINLKYSDDFPEIKNISATANFTDKNMKIVISDAEVLQSRISEGLVVIEDFNAKNLILKLSGKAKGKAANTLQHANNNPDFVSEVAKYLNGNSESDFDIHLPLSKEITLKNSYLAINSTFTKLDNAYLKGDAILTSKKNFGSVDFVTNFDLTAADLDVKELGLTKKSAIESQLSLIVSVQNPKIIQIKNISLWKKEGKITEKFSGELSFATSPFLVKSANFKNTNFNKNNYLISYQGDLNAHKISFRGDKINLGTFLKQKSENKNFPDLAIQIAANRADLLNNKFLKNFYFSLNCKSGLCSRGLVRASYGKQQVIDLKIEKTPEKNSINARVSDVGYIAEALDISNVVSGGDAKLKIEHYAEDNKPALRGTLTIDDDITIYENEAVKRFNKDTLFSQVRDKIFSSEKTTFDSVKINFDLQNYRLTIKSLIANNYKIGVTAKGEINLADKSCHLKGMIIPGFIVNNLFGIGKIPLVGGVISGVLTGGEGGGLFGIRYEYEKNPNDKEAKFSTNKVAAFVPSTIQNLFD